MKIQVKKNKPIMNQQSILSDAATKFPIDDNNPVIKNKTPRKFVKL